MAEPNASRPRDSLLVGLHVAFASFMVPLSLVLHGRLPFFSADESAALGFLLFFGLGLPMLLIVLAFCAVSVFAGGRYVGMLALAMLACIVLAVANVWTGVVASLAYLGFAAWALVVKRKASAGLA